jgi:4-hydroxy-tetrahydrodipicolinate reductase
METIILGDGGLGRAIAAALGERGMPPRRLLGRPAAGQHRVDTVRGADVVFEASRGEAVASNVETALAAGCRRLVIGTTGWASDRPRVEAMLRDAGAAAIAASNLSIGAALFGRLIEAATALFGPVDAFDPYLVEWHRSTKADRPSGTALDLAARIIAAHPRKARTADASREGPAARDELEVAVVRAGASPGMHLVGFDAAGETVELRITARDRSAYAAGALAAADWLCRERRTAGLHAFDQVVDDLLALPAAPARRLAATA